MESYLYFVSTGDDMENIKLIPVEAWGTIIFLLI